MLRLIRLLAKHDNFLERNCAFLIFKPTVPSPVAFYLHRHERKAYNLRTSFFSPSFCHRFVLDFNVEIEIIILIARAYIRLLSYF